MPFLVERLSFARDRAGLELDAGREVEIELDFEELGIDPDDAPEQLGVLLTTRVGELFADEEGLFDLSVHEGDELVAVIALACEDDALEVVGERLVRLSQDALVAAVRALLASA